MMNAPRATQSSYQASVAKDYTSRDAAERELMQRIRNGETDLFYELVRPYERAVFLSAASILGNDTDAEEVAQEAMLKAFKNLSRFREESKFSTWLIQIAMNESKMKLRKDRRHLYDSIDNDQTTEEGDYIPKDFADWREIPSEALQRTELRAALNRALASLSEKYRTVLILRDVQQLSISETAQLLDISEENVKTRTSRARLQMRDALAPGWSGAWQNASPSSAALPSRVLIKPGTQTPAEASRQIETALVSD